MNQGRLNRLERTLRRLGDPVCPLCHEHPVAAVRIIHERDLDGPGFRNTGECFLLDDERRITDDLRCSRCGAPATVIHLMEIARIGKEHLGRPVKLPDRP